MIENEQDLDSKLQALLDMREKLHALKEDVKTMQTAYDMLNREITEYFQLTGTQGKKIFGMNFYLNTRTYSEITDPDVFDAWVEKNSAYKLVMAINKSKLNAFCDEALAAGSDIPDGVTPNFIEHSIRIRKQ